MIKKLKIFKLVSGNSTYSQLFRTYVVGAINLVFGLGMTYIFQFYVFFGIQVPLRTYLTNIFAFSIGVIISYFLSRKIIFKLSIYDGGFKEFIKFVVTNLINLIVKWMSSICLKHYHHIKQGRPETWISSDMCGV